MEAWSCVSGVVSTFINEEAGLGVCMFVKLLIEIRDKACLLAICNTV
jgi:hypothetical protein